MIFQTRKGPIEVSDETIACLQKVWPTKHCDSELAKMHIWLLAHPSKQPRYFWTFVRNWMRKAPDVVAPLPKGNQWWKSEKETLEMGMSLGVTPRNGEAWSDFRVRVSAAIAARQSH